MGTRRRPRFRVQWTVVFVDGRGELEGRDV
jgi:hypothetical protein